MVPDAGTQRLAAGVDDRPGQDDRAGVEDGDHRAEALGVAQGEAVEEACPVVARGDRSRHQRDRVPARQPVRVREVGERGATGPELERARPAPLGAVHRVGPGGLQEGDLARPSGGTSSQAVVEQERPEGTDCRRIMLDLGLTEEEVGIVLINSRHVSLDQVLHDGDTLAMFPLVGGG